MLDFRSGGSIGIILLSLCASPVRLSCWPRTNCGHAAPHTSLKLSQDLFGHALGRRRPARSGVRRERWPRVSAAREKGSTRMSFRGGQPGGTGMIPGGPLGKAKYALASGRPDEAERIVRKRLEKQTDDVPA